MKFTDRLYIDIPVAQITKEILSDCVQHNETLDTNTNVAFLRKNKDGSRAILTFKPDDNPREWINELGLIVRIHSQAFVFYNSDPDWNWSPL